MTAHPQSTAITVALPMNAADVAALQRQAEYDVPSYLAVEVADADTYQFADALLTDVAQRKDAITAMRKSATGPMYTAVRTVEAWFKPVTAALESAEAHLKSVMGAWRLAEREREAAAREATAVAAEAGDAATMIAAVSEAAAIAAPTGARATTRFVWIVKRIAADLIPPDWMVPDVARIEALARSTPGDADAPVVPGVIFERIARLGARR